MDGRPFVSCSPAPPGVTCWSSARYTQGFRFLLESACMHFLGSTKWLRNFVLPVGIEPTSQLPQSCVLSIERREHIVFIQPTGKVSFSQKIRLNSETTSITPPPHPILEFFYHL